jgi:hypothetical protein
MITKFVAKSPVSESESEYVEYLAKNNQIHTSFIKTYCSLSQATCFGS